MNAPLKPAPLAAMAIVGGRHSNFTCPQDADAVTLFGAAGTAAAARGTVVAFAAFAAAGSTKATAPGQPGPVLVEAPALLFIARTLIL